MSFHPKNENLTLNCGDTPSPLSPQYLKVPAHGRAHTPTEAAPLSPITGESETSSAPLVTDTPPPPMNVRPVSEITNQEIIAALFTDLPAGAQPAVCSKLGDPNQGGWYAQSADVAIDTLSPDHNNYVNCSSFKPDANGHFAAKNEQFAATHFLLIDDVGTKVAPQSLGDLKPTVIIETSPGNFQWLIKLKHPIQSQLARSLVAALIKKGLTDSGATGHNRWARLPVGINGKEKYRDAAGQPFRCRLAEFNPAQTYSIDKLIVILRLDMSPPGTTHPAVPTHDPQLLPLSLDSDELAGLLAQLDPNMGRPDWIRVLMAVWHETQGSEVGFELVNRWSSDGKSYGGTAAMRVQWNSFGPTARPVTVGTLIHMVRQAGGHHEKFTVVASEPVPAAETAMPQVSVAHTQDAPAHLQSSQPSPESVTVNNPLWRFAVTNDVSAIERNVQAQRFVLGQMALAGQSTVIYASPNTGKTLITLFLLSEAVSAGNIVPRGLYYINMDDSASGLLEKSRLVQEQGFHMIGTGYNGFSPTNFRAAMEEMVRADTAKDVVVILDTLKKFVNLMHKEQSSEFAALIRQFTVKGGTVIALAHANKRPDTEGNPIYQGTTDIVDDSDCAYTIKQISDEDGTKVIEFTNIKRRGDAVANAWYRYSTERISYAARLQSVQEVPPDAIQTLKKETELASDLPVIAAVEACVREGITTKMAIAKEVANRCQCSRKQAIQVLEKHTGADPALHRWNYEVQARGAQHFVLHATPAT